MLIMRGAQLQLLGEVTRRSFEARLVAHVERFFPDECAPLSSEALGEIYREGVARAAEFGIEAERDVCKFINLMFVFGREFYRDPELPWAATRLADDRVGPMLKLNRLYLDGLDHRGSARGLGAGKEAGE